MSNTKNFKIIFDTAVEISGIKEGLEKAKQSLSKIELSDKIKQDFSNIFSSLEKEISNFSLKSKNNFNSITDVRNFSKNFIKIQDLFEQLQRNINSIDFSKLKGVFSEEEIYNINNINTSIKNISTNIQNLNTDLNNLQKGFKTINFSGNGLNELLKDIINLSEAGEDYSKELDILKKKIESQDGSYSAQNKEIEKQTIEIDRLKKSISDLTIDIDVLIKRRQELNNFLSQNYSENSYNDLIKEQENLNNLIRQYKEQYTISKGTQEGYTTTKEYDSLSKQLNEIKKRIREFETLRNSLISQINNIDRNLNNKTINLDGYNKKLKEAENQLSNLIMSAQKGDLTSLNNLINLLNELGTVQLKIESSNQELEELNNELDQINNRKVEECRESFDELDNSIQQTGQIIEGTGEKIDQTVNKAEDLNKLNQEFENLWNSALNFFSLSNSFNLLEKSITKAYESVKELDASMTDIAVVTNFDISDMWDQIPTYTDLANKLGTTILGAYDTAKLYYQQGLDNNEVMKASEETMKMARIANMDYSEATDYMTSAIRGFKLEMEDTTRVNDVFSKLAAITASDTQEIADALTRTASIANSAGMSLETTSAFLTQMIETTREAPENLGTAMKTIIARFQELKKAPSEIEPVDGEMVDANAIETALKTVQVNLRDTNGEFRNLDDVLLELASKWDNLDINTQRYLQKYL